MLSSMTSSDSELPDSFNYVSVKVEKLVLDLLGVRSKQHTCNNVDLMAEMTHCMIMESHDSSHNF